MTSWTELTRPSSTTWTELTAPGPNLLQEDSFDLLQEDGSSLILLEDPAAITWTEITRPA